MAAKTQSQLAGFLLVDKPVDWSSHDVVNRVRRLTGVKKVGHTGTLDPLATGLLIVLVGRQFTKLQDQYLKQDKVYQVTGRLGFVSSTYDVRGQVAESADIATLQTINQVQLEQVLKEFEGEIEQQVPAFSAVKIKGRKLYELARADDLELPEELPSRVVRIDQIRLQSFDWTERGNLEFSLEVACGSGTYIRSLVHDIGQELGVGAMVTELRRTKIGEIAVDRAVTLQQLEVETVEAFLKSKI